MFSLFQVSQFLSISFGISQCLIMNLVIYIPMMLSCIIEILSIINFFQPSRFGTILKNLLPMALWISNIVLIFFYMNWFLELPKSFLSDMHMDHNYILNLTRKLKVFSSNTLLDDINTLIYYFNLFFPIFSSITEKDMIKEVVPPEVRLCGILSFIFMGAWLGKLIYVTVLLYVIGNFIKNTSNLYN